MLWAIMGHIEFEVLHSPVGQEHRFAATFAEHARIAGKPVVQAVGGELDEIRWDIRLHSRIHDVAERLRAIREASRAQQPLALVMGDGTYLGPWLIVEGAVTASRTTAQGQLISADVQITLREYTSEVTDPTSEQRVRLAVANNPVLPGLITQPVHVATHAQRLAQAARTVQTALSQTHDAIARAQHVSSILGTLAQAHRGALTMQSAESDWHAIAQLGAVLVAATQATRLRLIDPTPEPMRQRLADAAHLVRGAMQHLEQARAPVLALTANVAMRRV